MTDPEKQKLVSKLRDMFQSSLDHPAWRDYRKEGTRCFRYRDGDQWTPEELKELETRGQPPFVSNQVKVFLDYLLGQVIKHKTRTRFRGRNVPEDSDTGHILTELHLYTEQVNKYRYQADDRNEDTACSGFGVSKMVPTYNDILKQPDIKITTPDCLDIYPDPYSSAYDWSDCKFVCEAPWLDVGKVQARYPKFKSQLAGLINNYSGQSDSNVDAAKGHNYIDQNRKRIHTVEIWWVEHKTKTYILLSGEGEESIDVSDWSERKIKKELKTTNGSLSRETKKVIHMAVFVDNLLLEYVENPYNVDMLPYVPQFARRKKNGQPYSFVSLVLPIQDSINKRGSKAQHLLNNNQAVYEEGAIEDETEEALNRAKPDGAVKVAKNALKDKRYQIIKNTEIAATQMSFHKQDLLDVRRVAGINPDALGEKSEVRSGIGISKKQAASQITIVKFIENLNRTNDGLARLWLKYVQEFYNTEMTFYITGDVANDFKASTRVINKLDPGTGNVTDNVTIGDYDIVIEQMQDTNTMHQQNVELLIKAIPQLATLGPGWGKIILHFMDLPGKEEVLQQFDAITKRPPEPPKINLSINWENASENDKEFFRKLMGNDSNEKIDLKVLLEQMQQGRAQ